ncbi:MAG: four helix bundle protein [bacterium]
MSEIKKQGKPHNLKERTFLFALEIVRLVNKLPKTIACVEIGRQLIKAGTSVGANLEEADDAASIKVLFTKLEYPEEKRKKADIG